MMMKSVKKRKRNQKSSSSSSSSSSGTTRRNLVVGSAATGGVCNYHLVLLRSMLYCTALITVLKTIPFSMTTEATITTGIITTTEMILTNQSRTTIDEEDVMDRPRRRRIENQKIPLENHNPKKYITQRVVKQLQVLSNNSSSTRSNDTDNTVGTSTETNADDDDDVFGMVEDGNGKNINNIEDNNMIEGVVEGRKTEKNHIKRKESRRKKKTRMERMKMKANTNYDNEITAKVSENNNDNDNTSSACVLWMDDNFRLEEWIAYHYYIMRLRNIVISIDHKSKTSPQAIVDRWNDVENKYDLNMTIVTWTDSEYIIDYEDRMKRLNESIEKSSDLGEHGTAQTLYHIYRQRYFYRVCTEHLYKNNRRTWVSYHDTDEFITFRHYLKKGGGRRGGKNITLQSIKKMERPGYVIDWLNSVKAKLRNDPINGTGFSCYSLSRRRYCSNELSDEETEQLLSDPDIVPVNFMMADDDDDKKHHHHRQQQHHEILFNNTLKRLDTLRYKYVSPGYDGQHKSIIDLSQRNPILFLHNKYELGKAAGRKWNVHRPMRQLCDYEDDNRSTELDALIKEQNLIINHYLGSWTAYSSRDDARRGGLRSYETWLEKSNHTKGEYSHVIRPWLVGFVKLVGGTKIARYLLQDAGKFPTTTTTTKDFHRQKQQKVEYFAYKYKFGGSITANDIIDDDDQTRRDATKGLLDPTELQKARKRNKRRKNEYARKRNGSF